MKQFLKSTKLFKNKMLTYFNFKAHVEQKLEKNLHKFSKYFQISLTSSTLKS